MFHQLNKLIRTDSSKWYCILQLHHLFPLTTSTMKTFKNQTQISITEC